jgi:hypothetical protein
MKGQSFSNPKPRFCGFLPQNPACFVDFCGFLRIFAASFFCILATTDFDVRHSEFDVPHSSPVTKFHLALESRWDCDTLPATS